MVHPAGRSLEELSEGEPRESGLENSRIAGLLMAPGRRVWTTLVEWRVALTALAVFAASMLVYLRTVTPGLEFMDTGEFQTVTYVLGIAHPTGYPLYTIVGKLFGTLLPVYSWAFRMNLMSALCAAIAAAMLAVLAIRYKVSPLVAFVAALGFAFALNTWKAADKADPYTLTVMIGAALWLLEVKWGETGERCWLWAIAIVAGVGLGSAGVLAMELPAIITYAVITQPRKFFAPSTMIVAGLLGIVGAVGIYSFLPIRASMNPPLNYGDTITWKGFQFVVLGGQVGGVINYLTWPILGVAIKRLPQVFAWYEEWLTPAGRAIGVLFALVGLGTLVIREWRLALCIALGFIVPIYPTLTIPINDTSHYVLISNWLLLFVAAVGAQVLIVYPILKIDYGSFRQSLYLIAGAALLCLPVQLAQVNWDAADMHDHHDAEIAVQKTFPLLKPNAVVISWWGPSTAFWYGKYVEGLRPDVEIIDDSQMSKHGWTVGSDAIAYYFGKRPVYTVPFWDELEQYRKRFRVKLVADLHVFGLSLYEIVGPVSH
ncbi:MAG: DUF2723 domain-containing protein [Candidatus Binatus sp.]|uniref:protein O-mannosyl-transferase family n=1 Tax=Candidatus Binatus sp. TaxID=2811406 RepID=UPI003C71336A